MTMKTRLALAAVVVFLLRWPAAMGAEGNLSWQKGFPVRAGSQVLLLWLPHLGAERYVVVRREVDTAKEARWEVLGLQYMDTTAAPDRAYLYTVQAVLPGGAPGPVSEPGRIGDVRPLDAPKWIGETQDSNVLRLAWERVDRAVFYSVYRAEGQGSPVLVASVQDAQFTDGKIKPGVAYTYTVRAVGPDSRESAASAPRRITVKAAKAAEAETGEPERRYVEVLRTIREGPQYRLTEPTDLAVSKGSLFVTNQGTRTVLVLSLDGDFLYQFGGLPIGYVGPWGIPWGLDVDAGGDVVAVAFLRSSNVRVFDRKGTLLRDIVIGRPAGFEEWPDVPQPMDVAIGDSGDLWVSEYTYGQVIHLDAEGKELGRIGTPRPAPDAGPFRSPTFLLSSAESVFVVDSLRAAVFGVAAGGETLWVWDRFQAREGALNLPKGIGLEVGGNLLIVDGLSSSLQSFRPGGKMEAVYYSKNKDYLDLKGLVSVAVNPQNGEIYTVSKENGVVYRLKVVATTKAGQR